MPCVAFFFFFPRVAFVVDITAFVPRGRLKASGLSVAPHTVGSGVQRCVEEEGAGRRPVRMHHLMS